MDARNKYTDPIEQEARILRVSRMIPLEGELDLGVALQVLNLARDYMRQYTVARETLARSINTSESYLSTLFSEADSGKLFREESKLPAKARDKLIRDINKWLEVDFRGKLGARPRNFVLHAAAAAMVREVRTIVEMKTIGVISGPAGLGKTMTAEYLVREVYPGALYVFIDHDCISASGLLRKIYAATRLRRESNTVARLEHVVAKLEGTNRVLFIDQAHDLRADRCFRLLCNLHDQAHIPIVLLGTEDVDRKTQADNDPEHGQLSSRIGHRYSITEELFRPVKGGRRLQWISVDELRRMYAPKMRFAGEAWKALAAIANFEVGWLRTARNVAVKAEGYARGQRVEEVQLPHVEAAWASVARQRRALGPAAAGIEPLQEATA